MPHQAAITVRAPLRRGWEADVGALMAQLRECVDRDGQPFRDFAGVHFARVFLIPGEPAPETGNDTSENRAEIPATLVYMADVDAPAHVHLRDLAVRSGLASGDGRGCAALDALFGLCHGYPNNAEAGRRLGWLRRHSLTPVATYAHRVGRGLDQVRAEARLRERIEDFLDQPGQGWTAPTPIEVHRAVRDFVGTQRDLAWALRPPPRPSMMFQIRETAHKVALPAMVLVSLPVLLPLLPVFAILIRRLELRDQPEHGRPSPERVRELTAIEDFVIQNPFTAMGTVKPGLVRRITLNAVLRGIDYASRHVYNTDNLAGVRTIHFARWVPLDGGRRLIFASSYDGSLESYMDDFIDQLAWGLNAAFSNGMGYPRTRWLLFEGARREQDFKRYLRRHQLPSVWYSAYGDLSARNIDENTQLREGLTRDLDTSAARVWLALL